MVGNGILAFAVIFVVVIFIYMSLRLQKQKDEDRNFIETYTITLEKGFIGDSLSLMINDLSLIHISNRRCRNTGDVRERIIFGLLFLLSTRATTARAVSPLR